MNTKKNIIKHSIIIGINFLVNIGLIVFLSILATNYVTYVELAIFYYVLFAIAIAGCTIRIIFSIIDLARAIKEHRQSFSIK